MLEGGGYALVTGSDKLKQDLSLALEEPIGTDRFHRMWGSVLDSLIGQPNGPALVAMVQTEVERVLSNYLTVQQALLSRDALAGRTPRYGSGEVIQSVDSVQVSTSFDTISVLITLTTLSDQQVALTYTLEA